MYVCIHIALNPLHFPYFPIQKQFLNLKANIVPFKTVLILIYRNVYLKVSKRCVAEP
jgi:hypothetical protein